MGIPQRTLRKEALAISLEGPVRTKASKEEVHAFITQLLLYRQRQANSEATLLCLAGFPCQFSEEQLSPYLDYPGTFYSLLDIEPPMRKRIKRGEESLEDLKAQGRVQATINAELRANINKKADREEVVPYEATARVVASTSVSSASEGEAGELRRKLDKTENTLKKTQETLAIVEKSLSVAKSQITELIGTVNHMSIRLSRLDGSDFISIPLPSGEEAPARRLPSTAVINNALVVGLSLNSAAVQSNNVSLPMPYAGPINFRNQPRPPAESPLSGAGIRLLNTQ